MKFFLDHKLSFRFSWFFRRAGGLALGFRASMPVQVVFVDDSHWWAETLTLMFLFFSISVHYYERIIPHSPAQTFK